MASIKTMVTDGDRVAGYPHTPTRVGITSGDVTICHQIKKTTGSLL